MKTKDFIASLKQFANQMGIENNPHLVFWSERMASEVNYDNPARKQLTGNQSTIPLVHHNFSLTDKNLSYLPLSLEMDEERLNREFNEECLAVHSGTRVSEYRRQREEELRSKESWIVKKIFAMSKDLMTCVNVISKKTNIPVDSLVKILNVILTDNGTYKLFLTSLSIKTIDVLLPEDTPADDRDKLVMAAWNQLYDLLLECLCLIILMGTVEFTRLVYCINFAPQDFFSYLLDTAVYHDQEDQLLLSETKDELWRYIYNDLHIYADFFPIFHSYIQAYCKIKAEKYYPLTETPFRYTIEPHLRDNINPVSYADMLEDKMSEGKDNKDDAESDRTSHYKFFDKIHGDKSSDLTHKYKLGREGDRQKIYSDAEIHNFAWDIGKGMRGKILRGLLSNYKLRGNPYNLLGYIGAVMKNVSLSIVGEHHEEILKAEYRISSRTRRRYKKDFELGDVHTSAITRNPDGVKFNDLEPEHIDEIKSAKLQRKQHHREGFLTQRQLINLLRSDTFINRFNKETGLQFKKYSAPTLLKRLQTLIQLNKIGVVRTESAFQYEASKDNLFRIVNKIINLSDGKF
ncbi:MAG: hypothetical protein ACLP9S_01015 [Syntrophales bacterium]